MVRFLALLLACIPLSAFARGFLPSPAVNGRFSRPMVLMRGGGLGKDECCDNLEVETAVLALSALGTSFYAAEAISDPAAFNEKYAKDKTSEGNSQLW